MSSEHGTFGGIFGIRKKEEKKQQEEEEDKGMEEHKEEDKHHEKLHSSTSSITTPKKMSSEHGTFGGIFGIRKKEEKKQQEEEDNKVKEEHKEADKHHDKLHSSTSSVEAPKSEPSEPGQDIYIVKALTFRPQTNPNDGAILALEEAEEKIPEEEAVCKLCFTIFEVGENMLKTKCKCKNGLVHEECADNWSTSKGNNNCDVCEEEVQNIHVTLLHVPGAAMVHKHKGKEHKLFSLFRG